MLEINTQDGDIVFYRKGQPVSESMSALEAFAYLRGDNVKKERRS